MSRYTLEFGQEIDQVLARLSEQKKVPKAEVIRRALASYAYLNDEAKEGKKVSITNQNDNVLKDVVLP